MDPDLTIPGDHMPAPSERGSISEPATGAGREWLGKSVWQGPQLEISRIKSWPSIAAMHYHREGSFADRILVESLGTALCIGIAQHFVGHLPLPTSKGLSPERLQRVRDCVEAHLDDDLSLTVLADIACLSPTTSAARSSRRSGWGHSVTSCYGGSNERKP